MLFVVPFMYVGIFLFYLGLAGSNRYRLERFRAPNRQLIWQAVGLFVAFGVCLLVAEVRWAVILVTVLLVAAECCTMWALYHRGARVRENS